MCVRVYHSLKYEHVILEYIFVLKQILRYDSLNNLFIVVIRHQCCRFACKRSLLLGNTCLALRQGDLGAVPLGWLGGQRFLPGLVWLLGAVRVVFAGLCTL